MKLSASNLIAILFLLPGVTHASVMFTDTFTLSATTQATHSDNLKKDGDRLIRPAPRIDPHGGTWILFDPVAIGRQWRTSRQANLRVTPELSTATPVSVYVRYSTDKQHWSTWQPLRLEKEAVLIGSVSVPTTASSEYDQLFRQWSESNRDRSKDGEDAFCRWLVKKYPSFFSSNFPFIGYLQVLTEFYYSPVSLRAVKIEASQVMNGLGMSPNVLSDVHWHFPN